MATRAGSSAAYFSGIATSAKINNRTPTVYATTR